MNQRRRGNENDGSSWELDIEPQVPEYEMATLRVVEVAKGLDSTEAKRAVQGVAVLKGAYTGAKVEGRRWV